MVNKKKHLRIAIKNSYNGSLLSPLSDQCLSNPSNEEQTPQHLQNYAVNSTNSSSLIVSLNAFIAPEYPCIPLLSSGRGRGVLFFGMCLKRALQDWEVDDLLELLGSLYAYRGLDGREDELRWLGPGNGMFL